MRLYGGKEMWLVIYDRIFQLSIEIQFPMCGILIDRVVDYRLITLIKRVGSFIKVCMAIIRRIMLINVYI